METLPVTSVQDTTVAGPSTYPQAAPEMGLSREPSSLIGYAAFFRQQPNLLCHKNAHVE